MSSSWPKTIPASWLQKVVVMLAFLMHTRFFPTCAGWRGERGECLEQSEDCVVGQDWIVTHGACEGSEEMWKWWEEHCNRIFLYIYIWIYILTGKFWDDWSFQQRFWFFFLPLSNNFMPCLLFWEDLFIFLASVWQTPYTKPGGEEVVIIFGRRAEWIWRFLYWLQCSPSFLPPPCPL